MSPRRKLWFAAVALSGVSVAMLLCVVAADLYAHARTQDVGGVNIWGYRGPVVGDKPPNGIRMVVLGGSTAFGWGLPAHESIAAFLERRMREQGALGGRPVSVVNLGAPAQGAFGFLYDLRDYAYLDYDVAILYEGLNDLGPFVARGINNDYLFRRESPIFQATGYFPVLPVVLRDRARFLLSGGDLAAAYSGRPITFTPGLATRATAAAMQTAASVSERVSAQLGGLSKAAPPPDVDSACVAAWRLYCGRVKVAVEWALAHGTRVLFVTQPYMSDAHVEQQANVSAMLQASFGTTGLVAYLNLGRLIDMTDRSIAYDGVHLVARGNELVANSMIQPLLDLIASP